jgi:hypothetical protein
MNSTYMMDGNTDYKRKLQLLLMQQQMTPPKIDHWTQGLAHMANSALMGYATHREDQAEKAARDEATRAPGLPGSMPPQPPTESPVSPGASGMQPPSPPVSRRPVQSSPTVWGDKEGEAAGLYPPSQPPAPQPVAGFNDRFSAAAPTRSAVNIPPEMGSYIQRLLANKRTHAYGLQLYGQFAKPAEQYVPVADARGNMVGQRSTLTGEIKDVPKAPEALRITDEMLANPAKYGFKPGDPALYEAAQKRLSGMSTSVSVNNAANPILEGVGKQIVESRNKAYGAVDAIKMSHDARALLDEGMTTGAFADPRVMMSKVGALFGMDATQASNAEVFRGVIGQQVLSHIKALGANPSNADRDYIEKVQGGQIALEERSLRRLLDINEKYSRQAIVRFNTDAKKLLDANPDQYRAIAPLMQFEEPPVYQPRAAQPTPQQIQEELRRRGVTR